MLAVLLLYYPICLAIVTRNLSSYLPKNQNQVELLCNYSCCPFCPFPLHFLKITITVAFLLAFFFFFEEVSKIIAEVYRVPMGMHVTYVYILSRLFLASSILLLVKTVVINKL